MNGIVVKENKRSLPFKIKAEEKEGFKVYRIYDEYKLTSKRLLKKLNKDRIFNIAFDNNISRAFTSFFSGKINIITKNDILFNNLDKIVLKLSNSLGIKDGKLELGIVPGYKTDIAFKKINKLKNKLKTLYIYSVKPADYERTADVFYNETGIPVIIKDDFKCINCDILIYLDSRKDNLYKFTGSLIDIFEITGKKGVRDIRVSFKNHINEYNISDAVFNKILAEPFRVDSFVTSVKKA